MALKDLFTLGAKKQPAAQVLPVLPEEIYQTGVLNLQDVIAPHALKVNSRELELGLYLTIYGNTREEIDKVESEVRSILESRLVYIRPALFQQEQGFRSVLPIAT